MGASWLRVTFDSKSGSGVSFLLAKLVGIPFAFGPFAMSWFGGGSFMRSAFYFGSVATLGRVFLSGGKCFSLVGTVFSVVGSGIPLLLLTGVQFLL